MNITFNIHNKYTHTWTTNNIIKKPVHISRITTLNNDNTTYGLVLNNINNTRTSNNTTKQSPIMWVNHGYNSELVDIVIPPTSTWNWYIVNHNEQNVTTNNDIIVNMQCDIVK